MIAMTRIWYVVGVLAALVAVAIVVRGRTASAPVESPSPTPTIEAPTPTPTPTPKPVVRVKKTPTPVPAPTYAEVAQQYTGRRIQFDAYCEVMPTESTFLVGTDVLMDNRSPDDRVIKIGGEEHGLRGYGWKVVTMTATELPATLAIDCGTAKNVGKIVIEPLTTPTPALSPSPASSSAPLVSPSPDASPTASASPDVSLTPTP